MLHGYHQTLARLQAAALRTMFSALARAKGDFIPERADLRNVPDGFVVATAYRLVGDDLFWRQLALKISVIEVLEGDAVFVEEALEGARQKFKIEGDVSGKKFCQCFTPEAFHEELRRLLAFKLVVLLEPESDLLKSSVEKTGAGSL